MNNLAKPADELLAQATCAVIIEDRIVGTAWLLSDEGYLLTAGHLLYQEREASDEPHEQVEVRFSGDEVSYPAHQVACVFEPAQEVDFALLKLAQMPRNRQALPFSLARSFTGTFRLHGYGTSLAECAPGNGHFVGPYGPKSRRLFRLNSKQLAEEGFSGGAVYSDSLKAVVAIQVQAGKARLGPTSETVLAMPLYRIAEHWPLLRHLTAPSANPFGDKGRITDPKRFFDREYLLRQIFEELRNGNSLSLVGESQIGKSSVLSMICAWGPQQLKRPRDTFAYLTLQDVYDEEDFYHALCDTLNVPFSRGYRLKRALGGKRYVLCLDEIEKMAWEGFTKHVRSQLRGLADGQHAPLTLVIASRTPLAQLFPDTPELDSPLAGLCHELQVGPFPPNVARTFLQQRLNGTGVNFNATQINALIAKSRGNPAKLQEDAARLYRWLVGRRGLH